MIRALRFSICLDFKLEDNLLNAIKKNLSLVNTLSLNRVKEEFDKILAKYDDRNIRPMTYHIYVNSTAFVGSYNAATKTYTANG